jgi:hypothetical protein
LIAFGAFFRLYDGISFDWESPVDGYDDPMNAYYLDVVAQTTEALKAINPAKFPSAPGIHLGLTATGTTTWGWPLPSTSCTCCATT